MQTETCDQPKRSKGFDNDHLHLANWPEEMTTLCGLQIGPGEKPISNSKKAECPICVALAKYK